MKKHNEGYALVLVLVVITVLCLVALAMMAGSLKNLQNQQLSIERMEAKYAAQGETEKFVAGFEGLIFREGSSPTITGLKKETLDTLCSAIGVQCNTLSYVENGETESYLLIDLTASAESWILVNCTIKVTGAIISGELEPGVYYYNITDPAWEYASYTITEGGGAG